MRYVFQKASAAQAAAPAKDRNPEFKDNEFYKTDSQKDRILSWLAKGNTLTGLEALSLFDCWALSQRVKNLRDEGNRITTEYIKTGTNKRIARYSLQNPIENEG